MVIDHNKVDALQIATTPPLSLPCLHSPCYIDHNFHTIIHFAMYQWTVAAIPIATGKYPVFWHKEMVTYCPYIF